MSVTLIGFIGFCILSTGYAIGEYCYDDFGNKYHENKYCSFGCCIQLYASSDPCCVPNYKISSGALAGITLGSFAFLSIVLYITIRCCCGERRNSRSNGGEVIQTEQQTEHPVISYVPTTNTCNMQPQDMHAEYYNNGLQMDSLHYTGNVAQPQIPYNTTIHNPDFQRSDSQNADTRQTK